MADQITFSPTSWVTNGRRIADAGESIASATQSFVGSVSDPSVFGGNDMVGSVAAMIYGLMIQRLGGCLDTLAEGFSAHGAMVTQAGQTYEALESSQADQAQTIEGML